MARTTYNVSESSAPAKDGSFRSCLCAMLVFVAICIILILAVWPWRSAQQPTQKSKEDYNDPNEFEKLSRTKLMDETTIFTQADYPKTEITKYVTEKLNNVTEKPNDVTEKPNDVTEKPNDVTEKPNDVTEKPNDVTEKPNDVTEKRNDVTETSKHETETPKYVTETPKNETETPKNETETPKNEMDKTKPKTEAPANITTSVTETSKFEEKQPVTDKNEIIKNVESNNSIIVENKTETVPIMTTLTYESTKIIVDIKNGSDESTVMNTTDTNFDTTVSSVETNQFFTKPTEPNDYINVQFSSTLKTTNNTTVMDITTELSNITDHIIMSNISRTKGTHLALTEESTDSPQEEGTDSFEVIETDNLPLRETQITTNTPMVNSTASIIKSNNTLNENVEQLTTTKPSITPQTPQENENFIQNEKIPFLKLERPVCQEAGCKVTATRMLSRIKHSDDPCEGFYEYACAGNNFDTIAEDNWKRITLKLHEIHKDSSTYLKLFQKFYQSCVSFHTDFNYEQRVKEAKGILHSVSLVYDRTQEIPEQLTLTELLTRLLEVGSSPLFDISVDADKQHFVFQILPGRINSFLHNNDNIFTNKQLKCFRELNVYFNSKAIDLNVLYRKYEICLSNHSDYLNTVQKALEAFEEFSYLPEYNTSWHILDIRTAIEWEILNIQSNLKPLPIRQDILSKNYKAVTLSELQARYTLIDWKTLFSNLTENTLSDNSIIHLYFDSYFDELFKQMFVLEKRQQINALLGMFAYELYTSLVLPAQTDDYEKFCIRQTSNLLPDIASVMYLKTWTNSEIDGAQTDLKNTFKSVQAHMEMKLNNAEWLDAVSAQSIIKKLKNIQLYYGNTDFLKNDTYYNEKYKDAFHGYNDTYTQYVVALIKQNVKQKYNLFGKDIEGNMNNNVWWLYSTPYDKRPVSLYSTNYIVVPLGIVLRVPKKIPRYIYLAEVGYPIAKAIAHHFDPIGINYIPQIAEKTLKTYNTITNCASDKSSFTLSQNFNDKSLTFLVTGNLSISERVAEDIALELVLDMFKDVKNSSLLPWVCDTYSTEKVFFLNLAQTHCKNMNVEEFMIRLFENEHIPESLLVKNLLSNNNEFHETFQCPPGSEMNHPVKCATLFNLIEEDYTNYD